MAENTADEWRAECARLRKLLIVLRGCERCSLCARCLAAIEAARPPTAPWPAPHRW